MICTQPTKYILESSTWDLLRSPGLYAIRDYQHSLIAKRYRCGSDRSTRQLPVNSLQKPLKSTWGQQSNVNAASTRSSRQLPVNSIQKPLMSTWGQQSNVNTASAWSTRQLPVNSLQKPLISTWVQHLNVKTTSTHLTWQSQSTRQWESREPPNVNLGSTLKRKHGLEVNSQPTR